MKIKKKLLLSNAIVVLFSVLIVSIPILIQQNKELGTNIEESADKSMSYAYSSISSFLQKSRTIISDMSSYLKNTEIEKDSAINTFISAIEGDDSLYALYYADMVPIKDGGIFYSNDYWEPDSSYDKNQKDWFRESLNSQGNLEKLPFRKFFEVPASCKSL